jgi:hypothetical protein
MRKILNISQPQMGKTTYTLQETETCLDMVNLNMVFEYNMVVEDVLEKAKNFSFRADRIDKKRLDKYRSNLIDSLEPNFPTMLVGIMDVYRAQYVEGFLIVKDKDIEYGERSWHHNEYGEKVRLVQKFIQKRC